MTQSLQMIREKLRAKKQFIDFGSPVEDIQDFTPMKVIIPDYQKPNKRRVGWYNVIRQSLP